jgi:hypothetical protein
MWRFALLFGLPIALVAGQACAEASADPDASNVAVAMLAPEQQRIELSKALGFCAARLPKMRGSLDLAMQGWINRQSTLLYVAALYRSSARRKSEDTETPQATRDTLKKLLDVDIPRVIGLGVKTVLAPLSDADRQKRLAPACEAYLTGVTGGRFDLKTESPELAKFMEQSSPATSEATEGPP